MKYRRSPKGLIEQVVKDKLPDHSPDRLVERRVEEDFLFFEELAAQIIEASGEKPQRYKELAESEALDHVCLAAQVIKQVRKIKACIPLVERNPAHFRMVLHEAMVLAALVHQLTVVDNERSIAGDIGRREHLEEQRTKATRNAVQKNKTLLSRAETLRAAGMSGDRKIAKKIVKDFGWKFETIRKAIAKK